MGYNIDLINSEFYIAAEDKEAALNALFDMWLPAREKNMSGGSFSGGRDTEKWYSWMNMSAEAFRNRTIPNLETALDEWAFPVETDDHGNIVGIWFEGEKLGDEDQMLAAIAPFVRAGSYLDWHGEDGTLWRDEFDGTKVVQRHGRVVYE